MNRHSLTLRRPSKEPSRPRAGSDVEVQTGGEQTGVNGTAQVIAEDEAGREVILPLEGWKWGIIGGEIQKSKLSRRACVWVGVCVLSDYCTQKKEYWIQLNSCFNHPGNVYFSQPTHCFRWTGCELVGHLPAQRPEQNLWCNNNCISTTKYNTRADNLSFKRSWKICNIVVGVTITVSGKMGWNSGRKWSPQTIYKQSLTT